jgi:hypothetical protein
MHAVQEEVPAAFTSIVTSWLKELQAAGSGDLGAGSKGATAGGAAQP